MFFSKKQKTTPPFSAYSGDEPFTFVSYAHVDSNLVFPILGELHKRGVNIWYDEGLHAGAEWSQQIADRILHCEKFLLFVSPEAMNSIHVRQEINFANGKNKQFIPVFLKPTQLSAGLEMTLSVFQSIFYYTHMSSAGGAGGQENFYSQLYTALKGVAVVASAETELLGGKILKLAENADKSLPPIIHLPTSGTFTVGRFDISLGVQQNDFEFGKEKTNISRRHAVFECGIVDCSITDCSKTGIWINGKKIPHGIAQDISWGDTVAFGTAGAVYIFEG